MSAASDMLQTLSSFEMSTLPYAVSFFGTINSGTGGSASIRPYRYPTTTNTARSSILLPNGTKYDPHQTYDAPQTPGVLSYSVVLKPASSSNQELVESAITGYYNDFCVQAWGKRGTLVGAAYGISTSTSATARLIRVSMEWGLPKQIPTDIGGSGSATPGVKTAIVNFEFDLLTSWSFTY